MASEPEFRAHYDPCPHPHKVGYKMRWHALRAADKLHGQFVVNDIRTPLPDELPAEITPEVAEELQHALCWAIDRAEELRVLLSRRSL